jgi:hypothetical protein
MALVEQAFPEDTMVDVATLREQGVLNGGLSGLNAHLVSHGWQLELVRDLGRIVGAVRRRMSTEAREGAIGELGKNGKRHHSKDGW